MEKIKKKENEKTFHLIEVICTLLVSTKFYLALFQSKFSELFILL